MVKSRKRSVLVLGVLLAAGCGHGLRRHVAMPPPDASPRTVVQTYLAALDGHDRVTAAALLEPLWRRTVEHEVDPMLTNVKHLRVRHISAPTPTSLMHDGAYRGWQTTSVQVVFILSQYHAQSMPNGTNDWGYVLARKSASTPWRIVDEGQG